MTPTPTIRVGIGGWLYEPWRDNFYPAAWPQKRELEYASRKVSAIEIDSTYYRLQKPRRSRNGATRRPPTSCSR
jgi:uncharacterized protein YecE (DUF72 family)